MKKFFGMVLALSTLAGSAQAASPESQTLRAGIERVKANVDSVITQMGGSVSLNEADADLLRYLLTSSKRFEQGQTALDDSDEALDNGDTDGYLNGFAEACNRVAAARAQLGNAARRARDIKSTFPKADFVEEQKTDITDTRDLAKCPH
ncbi:MAG TPA: hypothetical protein VE954_20400 [Oligoflexus sp.]|uniref:hypothetical protein n=1 Tax=Oligoflexus sp. TaxID=1971216 RepID=UPI002D469828|nr:hypothetical protein [Oligoflexus sp.]HYX35463.1 hypothetical protein [Oligoflexus sp.]